MRRTVTFLLAGVAALALAAGCSHHGTRSYEDQLRCTPSGGCEICDGTTCYPYYCDANDQCPADYTCTASGTCAWVAPDDGSGGSDLECDASGCVTCRDTAEGRDCQAYVCDAAARPCPSGWTCENASCVSDDGGGDTCETECCANADCAEGFVCSRDGVCVERPTPPADECDAETPCPEGEVCQDGQCVTPPPECTADGDCAAGQVCTDGSCVTRDFPPRPADRCVIAGDCGPEGTCVNGACHFACGAEGACPVTQECRNDLCLDRTASPGECVIGLDCPTEGARCIDGTCRPTCAANEDCQRHERCDAARGLCEPDPQPLFECLSSGDCAADRDCVEGRCLAPCAAEGACPEGEACEAGWCVAQATCFDASGCNAGQACVNGTCESL